VLDLLPPDLWAEEISHLGIYRLWASMYFHVLPDRCLLTPFRNFFWILGRLRITSKPN